MFKKNTIIANFTSSTLLLMRFVVSLFVVSVLIRFFEFWNLLNIHNLTLHYLKYEIIGCAFDFGYTSVIFVCLLFPFFLLHKLHKYIAQTLTYVLGFSVIIISIILSDYFTISITPLDQVLYSYKKTEILYIIGASNDITTGKIIAYVIFLSLFVSLMIGLKNIFQRKIIQKIGYIGMLVGIVFFIFRPMPVNYFSMNKIGYYIKQNKIAYLLYKSDQYFKTPNKELSSNELRLAITQYRAMYPQKEFIGETYPFAYKTQINNTIGKYFSLLKEKPNIVLIIGESISRTFLSPSDTTVCVMPFLDSLKNHSLYWDDFVSTANRTFNVLPAVTGSLPFGDEGFAQMKDNLPDHNSLLSILGENNYYTSFYYGGWIQFDNMDSYLRHEHVDNIMNYFPNKYVEKNEWGYSDGNLFNRSFEVIDSLGVSKPRLDLYLTLSMHHPFEIPQAQKYSDEVKKIISNSKLSEWYKMGQLRYAKKLSTCLYTDNQLRIFFEKYKKRPEYKNTIFIITGDHSMDEISYHFNGINKFRVPLIIYSPLLNTSRCFHTVNSNLDITPTLLSLLADNKLIALPEISHWIGEELDTTHDFSAQRFIPTILNDRTITDFIYNNHFLSLESRIKYRLSENKGNFEKSKSESFDFWPIQNFIALNQYVCSSNKLTPKAITSSKTKCIYSNMQNFENINNQTINAGQLVKTTKDTVASGKYSYKMSSDIEYYDLVKKLQITQNTKYCFIEIQCSSFCEEIELWEKISPVVVFESNALKLLHYEKIKPESVVLQPNQWKKNRFRISFDIRAYTKTANTLLSVYWWNNSHILSYFDDISINIYAE